MIEALNNSGFAVAVRESQVIYPLLQFSHIIGFSLFAGGVVLANLRVAGVGSNVSLVEFVRYAVRVALAGFAMVLAAGLAMFVAFSEVFSKSEVMGLKMGLLLLALGNVAILQRGVSGANPGWATAPPNSVAARKWVALGVALFVALVVLGKLLAYIGGKD